MNSIASCRLYAFVDAAFLHGRNPADLARQLCEGGADIIQLRAKSLPTEEIRRMAEEILPVTRQAGVPLVINDHAKLTHQLEAECCHMGQEDFFDAGYRMAAQVTGCPKEFRLGLSTHSPDDAAKALRTDPDYIAIGPVYATGTKPEARPVTLDYVRWASANVKIPWFAIGGINLQNLDEVMQAGARRICVVSAILNAPDVTKACQTFKDRVLSVPMV